MRNLLQHYFNPLHIYCRLRGTFSHNVAQAICRAYERIYVLIF